LNAKELYAQVGVPFPTHGNTYDSLALQPDFKTREWLTPLEDGTFKSDRVWMKLTYYKECFRPVSLVCRESVKPELELFDFS